MNLLKRIFLSSFCVYTIVLFAYGIDQLFLEFNVSYLGIALAAFPVPAFFAKLYLITTARTTEKLWLISVSISFGVILTFFGSIENFDLILLLLSISILIGWLLYVFWYSDLNRKENTILQEGKQLPSFELENEKNEKVSSVIFQGKPLLMLFYRANWCPLCMGQIKELAASYQELANRGVEIVLVSGQSHGSTKTLAKRFDIPFHFLIDVDYQLAKEFDVFHENGTPVGMEMFGFDSDVVYPTVLITDKNGKIIFSDLTDNYRVRPEPQTFLKILDEKL